MAWFCLGVVGLLFRVTQLCLTRGVVEGLAWGTKIITDPFHDIYLYHKAPLYLLKGERVDPMHHVSGQH
jgi:hypothetical protein